MLYLSVLETEEDRLSFEQLYRKYRLSMLGLALSILENEADAEDAVNQAFLAAAESFAKIRELSEPQLRSYLMTAAKYKAADIYRERRKLIYVDEYPVDPPDEASAADSNPKIEALHSAMKKLPPLYRDLLTLRFDQELNTREIAHITGRKRGTVQKELWRAIQMLREIMQKEAGHEDR